MEALRILIAIDRIDQTELASRMDMHDSQLSEYLSGKRSIGPQVALRFSGALGVHPRYVTEKIPRTKIIDALERILDEMAKGQPGDLESESYSPPAPIKPAVSDDEVSPPFPDPKKLAIFLGPFPDEWLRAPAPEKRQLWLDRLEALRARRESEAKSNVRTPGYDEVLELFAAVGWDAQQVFDLSGEQLDRIFRSTKRLKSKK